MKKSKVTAPDEIWISKYKGSDLYRESWDRKPPALIPTSVESFKYIPDGKYQKAINELKKLQKFFKYGSETGKAMLTDGFEDLDNCLTRLLKELGELE